MKSQLFLSLCAFFCALAFTACDLPGNAEKATKEAVKRFPTFELEKLEGGRVRLEDYRGKVVVLNFWATWCAPCVAELPSLQKLQEHFADKGLVVLAVSVDPLNAKDDIYKLKDRLSLEFDILLDPEMNLPPELGITGFPETFFVGRKGEMLEVFDPVENKRTSRVISDRDWSSEAMISAIGALLTQ